MARSFLNQSWIRGRMHVSWHIAWASMGILLGAVIAPLTTNIFTGSEWLIVAGCLLSVGLVKRLRYLAIIALIAGMLVGLWRGSAEYSSLKSYEPYYGKSVHVQGTVGEDTSFGPKGDQRIRIGKVNINGTYISGTIWVSTSSELEIKRGDNIKLSGVLGEGFGNIPASMFRAQVEDVQRPYPGDVGRRVRDWFGQGVGRAMPQDDAQFALAYLVGQKLTLSDTLNDQLRTVGLIHAVVASGYHLTVLVDVVRRLFVRVSKYLTALFSAGMIGGFILITGFSPSMTRAGLVSGLGLAAWYYGRVVHPLVLLPFAAALTVLYSPEYIWGDVGWYLSFAAFTGVILLAPLLHHYFWGKQKRPGIIREILMATVAAQLVTLPITLYAFGYYSVYALLANILVVPLVPLTMLLTFVAGVAGLVVPLIASWFGAPVVWILQYMTTVVRWLANLPGARSEVNFSMILVVLSYLAIIGLTIYLWKVTGHNFKRDTDLQKEL